MTEEQTIKILKRRTEELRLSYAITNEDLEAIEIVLSMLKEKDKELEKNKVKFIFELSSKDKQEMDNKIKDALKKVEKSYITVIVEKINKYKQQLKNNTKRVVQLQVLEQNGSLQQSEWEELNILFGDIEKTRGKLEVLQELLNT